MNHRERIENAIQLKPTNRLPFGYWIHFPKQDRDPQRLAELEVELQEKLDLDFIKYMPFAQYPVVDWGVKLKYSEEDWPPPMVAEYPVKSPADWSKLKPLRGNEGEYGVVLAGQKIALQELKGEVPLVQTVFSPLTLCLKLAGEKLLLQHIAEHPNAVRKGLEVVTETTREFALSAVQEGADGLFFATQMSNIGKLSQALHAEFVKRYDLVVLEAIKSISWFNILHLHGPNVMIHEFDDYPVQVLNWEDRDGGPSLSEMRRASGKCFLGGIGYKTTLIQGSPEDVAAEVYDAWQQTSGRGLILGPGCSMKSRPSEENLFALKKTVERTDQNRFNELKNKIK